MTSQNTMHAYLDWVKERLAEIDATLTSFKTSAAKLQADARTKAEHAIADMRTAGDVFRRSMKEYGQAGEAAFTRSNEALEKQWTAFEASVQTYLDVTGKRVSDQQAIFLARAAAQHKAWQEAIDKLHKGTVSFAADRRSDIEEAVKHMTTEAAAAKVKLDKLHKAGGESWTAMKSALSETRASLDRTNKAAHDAFKRATQFRAQ